MNTEVAPLPDVTEQGLISPYASIGAFEAAQRMARSLATSTMVPADYRDSVSNCLVAMELANRVGASVLAVMQNSAVINGRPTWMAAFVIGAINSCGRFEPLRFRVEGDEDDRACVAWTKDREGNLIEGPSVSIGLAKAEGWFSRRGSKWQTMPDVMLRYRAATFFGRLYASDVLMGMQTADEAVDVMETVKAVDGTYEVQSGVDGLKDALTAPVETDAKVEETPVDPGGPQMADSLDDDIPW